MCVSVLRAVVGVYRSEWSGVWVRDQERRWKAHCVWKMWSLRGHAGVVRRRAHLSEVHNTLITPLLHHNTFTYTLYILCVCVLGVSACKRDSMSAPFCSRLKLLGHCVLTSVRKQCCLTCGMWHHLEVKEQSSGVNTPSSSAPWAQTLSVSHTHTHTVFTRRNIRSEPASALWNPPVAGSVTLSLKSSL